MKALVTGATGFIGGQLCRALLAKGHSVRAFHRPTSTLRLLEDLDVEHAIGDLTRRESVEAAMDGIEVVFHAAAQLGSTHDRHSGRMYAVTVEGTRTVLQAAREAKVKRVVHTSSVAALGVPDSDTDDSLPIDENHSWNYRPDYWQYGYSKYLAEQEVQKAAAGGLDVVIVNPSVVFGAGDVYRQTSSVIVQAARGRVRALVQGGLNLVHIQDVVDGHLAAWKRGRCGERYILGGENMTYVELLRQITAITGGSPPALVLPAGIARGLVLPLRLIQSFVDLPIGANSLRLAGYRFYYNTEKSHRELNLKAPRPTSQAIKEAYDWFAQTGALPV